MTETEGTPHKARGGDTKIQLFIYLAQLMPRLTLMAQQMAMLNEGLPG